VRLRHLLLGLLAFIAALVVVFPASWIKGALPPQVTCAALSGSLWRGQCAGLAFAPTAGQHLRVDALDWKLHPLPLLQGRLQADINMTSPDLSARGEVQLGARGQIGVTGLSGRILLDHSRLAALPAGWSAQAEAREFSIGIENGRLTKLGGVLLARQLRDARGTGFGDFRLEFPLQDKAPFRGALGDEGGPMQLQSQLELNADQSWQLRGTIRLRPGSPPGLASALDQLAPADINGVRTFALEGAAR
jgi:hypothetical protein